MKKFLLFIFLSVVAFSQFPNKVSGYELLDTLFLQISAKFGNHFLVYTNLSNNAIQLEDYLKQKFDTKDSSDYIKIFFSNHDQLSSTENIKELKGFYLINTKTSNEKVIFDITNNDISNNNYLKYIIFVAGSALTYLLFSIR